LEADVNGHPRLRSAADERAHFEAMATEDAIGGSRHTAHHSATPVCRSTIGWMLVSLVILAQNVKGLATNVQVLLQHALVDGVDLVCASETGITSMNISSVTRSAAHCGYDLVCPDLLGRPATGVALLVRKSLGLRAILDDSTSNSVLDKAYADGRYANFFLHDCVGRALARVHVVYGPVSDQSFTNRILENTFSN
jgi:predicted protein tyrosine phosphatase